MGFVAKSVFWLGLVYVAMPFDSRTPTALGPIGTAISPRVSPSLGSLAGPGIAATQVAAALGSSTCFRAPPVELTDAPAPKGSAEPLRRSPERNRGEPRLFDR
jgi:hypothetical protein